jgi:hypothetical protein
VIKAMKQLTPILIAIALAGCTVSSAPVAQPNGASSVSADGAQQAGALSNRLAALSPSVSATEAHKVALLTYSTVDRLAREYQMVWPSGLQNYLIQSGQRKRGYCFHWTEDTMVPLARLRLKTLELHWGEAFAGTESEHNCVVVTARGQPFAEGILLDGWRYSGTLFWAPVRVDRRQFQWRENEAQAARVLARTAPPLAGISRVTR